MRPDYEPDYYCEVGTTEFRFWWAEMVMETTAFHSVTHKLAYFRGLVWVVVESANGDVIQLSKLQPSMQDRFHEWLASEVVE